MNGLSLGPDDPRACAKASEDTGEPGQRFRQMPVTPLLRRHLKANNLQHPRYGIHAVCMKTALRERPQLAVLPWRRARLIRTGRCSKFWPSTISVPRSATREPIRSTTSRGCGSKCMRLVTMTQSNARPLTAPKHCSEPPMYLEPLVVPLMRRRPNQVGTRLPRPHAAAVPATIPQNRIQSTGRCAFQLAAP